MPAVDGSRHQGRRALVTGAATGIGRATAKRLAADGAAVVVNYVGGSRDAGSAVAEIEAAGGRAIAIGADVTKEKQVRSMFQRARKELGGPVDILVNNAGVESAFKLVDMPLDEWQRVIDVNLTGTFLCAREAARGMTASGAGGAIVNVSSVHQQIPWGRYSHYCASKGAMKLFAESISKELAADGIRVANVAPGAILTPINRDLMEDPRKQDAVAAEIPLRRIGRPEEIAAAISWLASAEASYVTGTTLFVDGGMTTYANFT